MVEIEGMKRLPPVTGKGRKGPPRVPYKCLSCGKVEETTRSAQSHKERCPDKNADVPDTTSKSSSDALDHTPARPVHEPEILAGGWSYDGSGKPGVVIAPDQPAAGGDADDQDAKATGDDADDQDAGGEDAKTVFGDAELGVIVNTCTGILEKRVVKWGVDPLEEYEREALRDAWVPVLRKILSGPHAAEWSAAIVTSLVFGPRVLEARKRAKAAGGDAGKAKAKPGDAGGLNGRRVDVDDLKRRLEGDAEAGS